MSLTEAYKILNLQEGVSLEEIKKAYRKLSMKYHPDQNDGDFIAGEMFKRINEAYNTLENKIKSDPNYMRDQELKNLKNEFNRLLREFRKREETIKTQDIEISRLRRETKRQTKTEEKKSNSEEKADTEPNPMSPFIIAVASVLVILLGLGLGTSYIHHSKRSMSNYDRCMVEARKSTSAYKTEGPRKRFCREYGHLYK